MKPLFRVGDEDPLIAEAQRRLLCPVEDGVFSDDLAARVRGFQWVHGLAVHGHLDQQTIDQLRGE